MGRLMVLTWNGCRKSLGGLWLAALCSILPFCAQATDCNSLERCYQAVLSQADMSRSKGALPNEADQALIARVTRYGAPALPLLFELLANNNDALASLTLVGLERMPPLDARYLPQLEQALARDLYVYRVLARVQQPRATELLVEQYIKDRFTDLRLLQGLPLLPLLQQGVVCPALCQQHAHGVMGYFDRLHALAKQLPADDQPQLLETMLTNVGDASLSIDVRRANLAVVAAMVQNKPAFSALADGIQASCRRQPELHASCQQALVTLRLPQAWRIVVAELHQIDLDADLFGHAGDLLTTLASFGPSANSAVAEVTRFLGAEQQWVRVQAAKTLLAIDPHNAIPLLLRQLRDPHDAQLSYELAQLLGPLMAAPENTPQTLADGGSSSESLAEPAPFNVQLAAQVRQTLRAVQTDYWYPPVRAVATRWLESPKHAAALLAEQQPRFSSIAPVDLAGLSCELAPLDPSSDRPNSDLSRIGASRIVDVLSPDARPQALSYWIKHWAFDRTKPATADVALNTPWTDNPQRLEKRPRVQLRLGRGWLTGRDDGEWGGELMYVDDHGTAQQLANDNIQALVTLRNTQLAIAGLAHLGINQGRIYRITATPIRANKPPQLHAKRWFELPARIDEWHVLQGDRLFLQTKELGSFVLSADGAIRMAECR